MARGGTRRLAGAGLCIIWALCSVCAGLRCVVLLSAAHRTGVAGLQGTHVGLRWLAEARGGSRWLAEARGAWPLHYFGTLQCLCCILLCFAAVYCTWGGGGAGLQGYNSLLYSRWLVEACEGWPLHVSCTLLSLCVGVQDFAVCCTWGGGAGVQGHPQWLAEARGGSQRLARA
eukprot:gene12550-biopygen19962